MKATVILLEKANVKRSGAICMGMGMDRLDNAVVPSHATPEQYTKEITIANDGIVNQKAVPARCRSGRRRRIPWSHLRALAEDAEAAADSRP